MIQSVNALRLNKAQDPFEQFSVEFGEGLQAPAGMGATSGADFGAVLSDALQEVNQAQYDSAKVTFDFATGKPVDIHTMMIAGAKADVLLQLTSAVVSKTSQGINQLLQIQV